VKPQRIAPQTYTIYGLNGALEVLNAQDYSINYIDIKSRSAAEKDQKINSLIKNYKSKVKILNADKFSIKYSQLRTQGIVVSFEGQIKKELPQFNNMMMILHCYLVTKLKILKTWDKLFVQQNVQALMG